MHSFMYLVTWLLASIATMTVTLSTPVAASAAPEIVITASSSHKMNGANIRVARTQYCTSFKDVRPINSDCQIKSVCERTHASKEFRNRWQWRMKGVDEVHQRGNLNILCTSHILSYF